MNTCFVETSLLYLKFIDRHIIMDETFVAEQDAFQRFEAEVTIHRPL